MREKSSNGENWGRLAATGGFACTPAVLLSVQLASIAYGPPHSQKLCEVFVTKRAERHDTSERGESYSEG